MVARLEESLLEAAAPVIATPRPVATVDDRESIARLEALPDYWRGRARARLYEAECLTSGHAADIHLAKAREYLATADRLAKWR